MTEEVKQPDTAQTETVEAPPTPDIFETKALDMGWRPKEEWDGAEEDFIEAKEFVRRQPLFEKIESQSKAIKQLNSAFDALKTHHTKVKESEYKRALDSLKQAKREALRDGETDRALAYEDKIEEVEQQKAEFDAEAAKVESPQAAEAHPDFVSWKQRNGWYNKDPEMKEFADTYGTGLSARGFSPNQVLEAVAKEVRKAFPAKFTNPNRDKPGAVEAPARSGATHGGFQLSEEERTIMNKLVRSGAFGPDKAKAEAAYIKELKQVKGL